MKAFETATSSDLVVEETLETIEARQVSPGRLAVRRFLRHRLAVASLIVLLLMALMAILAPLIAPHNPMAQDLLDTLGGPSKAHPLGTDDLGRDILSRLIFGARVTLGIGFGAALVVLIIGLLVGATAGYAGRWVDNLLMRFVDLVLAFPSLFLLLILAAYTGVNVVTIVLFIGFFGWMYLARLVRSQFLVIREMEYIQAARASGVSGWRTAWRHMLPNAVAAIIVNVTFAIAGAMYVEAALDFLGFGLPPEVPTWGNMLAESESYIAVVPTLSIAPGVLLTIAILAVNFVGDGLRDALDPRTK
jgi:ABC-type dipeptide/oligopeptide/nickel transport system permease subunit